jgi:hypothetical protein
MPKRSRRPEAPIRAIVAIDPAASAGIAVIADGKVLTARPAAGDRFWPLGLAVKAAWIESGCTVPFNEVLGVFESGWVNGRGGKGQHTLAIRRGLAHAALEYLGITRIKYEQPSVWMNALYGSIHKKDTKQLSMEFATQVLGSAPVNDDVSDAVALGMWAWREYCTCK